MAGLRFVGITLGAIALGVAPLQVELSAQAGAGGQGPYKICHTAGTRGVTLSLPASAVPAHLAHGDRPGACDASPSR